MNVRQNGRIVSRYVYWSAGAETLRTAFLRKLAQRGLRGVKLVVFDAHEGAVFLGVTHYYARTRDGRFIVKHEIEENA